MLSLENDYFKNMIVIVLEEKLPVKDTAARKTVRFARK